MWPNVLPTTENYWKPGESDMFVDLPYIGLMDVGLKTYDKKSYVYKVQRKHFSVKAKIECLLDLWSYIQEPVKTVFEVFSGVGISRFTVGKYWPEAVVNGQDYDERCVSVYRSNFPDSEIELRDAYGVEVYPRADLYTMDCFKMTLRDFREGSERFKLLIRASKSAMKYFCFTDSAHRYFHLNKQGYSCDSWEDYLSELNSFSAKIGFEPVAEAGFYEATYLLWKRRGD